MNLRTALLATLSAVLLLGRAAVAAAEDDSGLIHYQRVLVPEDRVKDWPTGGDKYLPVNAAEFERLVTPLRSANAPVALGVAITAARYEAKLVGDDLLGQAWADVSLLSGTPTPAMLLFEPCT